LINNLVDAGADFVTDSVKVGDVVSNITDNTYATVTAVTNLTTLALSENIFPDDPWVVHAYSVEGTRVKLMGWFRAEE
ncbi:unnamed protein product, partial [marine sediment metagenome]